jgi:hypothetical protein
VGRYLITAGVVLIVVGVAVVLLGKLGIQPGRLPGDIVIERDNFRLYVPIMTMLLVSVLLSLIFWLIGRL